LRANGSQAFPPTYRYVDTYVSSMNRFRSTELDLMLTSHYPIYRGVEIHEFLAESRAYVDRVDSAIQAELEAAKSPRTMRELIDALAPKLGEWPEPANPPLSQPLQGHLERMVQFGLIEEGRRDGWTTYRWK
jgi:hypothetical protein